MNDLDLCSDGFHSIECPGCGLTVEQRDGDMLAVNSAMDYGQGRADAEAEIARLRAAIINAINHVVTMEKAWYGVSEKSVDAGDVLAILRAALAQPEGEG